VPSPPAPAPALAPVPALLVLDAEGGSVLVKPQPETVASTM